MMTYPEAEAYLHSFTRFGSQLDLGRMRTLLDRMGNPQKKLRFVHIAGTNGKGSTAKMTSLVMQESGYRVGLYVSPFVLEFRERYQVNGEMISEEEFVRLAEELRPLVEQLSREGLEVTEFEAVTAIGFAFFQRHACDIVALEVGLGGRFDATNVIDTPECAVIASISLDHVDILGDTIEKIAGEKAGIIKENTDVVTYARQSPEAVAVFLEKCAVTGSRLILPNAGGVEVLECGVFGSRFRYGGEEYRISLTGEHQIFNAISVIEAANVLRRKGWNVPQEAVEKGLAEASFPARFELLHQNPMIVLDGAHNLQAANALAETMKKVENRPIVALMGMMADKDYVHSARAVSCQCDAVITVPISWTPRAVAPELLAQAAAECCGHVETIREYESALCRGLELAGKDGCLVICGSFYLAGDMRKLVKRYFANEIHQIPDLEQ